MRYSRMEILGSNPDHLSHPFLYKDVGKRVTARPIQNVPSLGVIFVLKDNIKMK